MMRALLVIGLLGLAPAAAADTVVLRNGQTLHITGFEREGAFYILHLRGGQARVAATEIARIEPENRFPAAEPQLPAEEQALLHAAAETGLDVRLLHSVAHAESGFDAKARSPRGAQGLMQLLPTTAAALGVHNPFNPEENARAGARYLQQLLAQFRRLDLALAAYNAGPERVKRFGGVPPYRETRQYLQRVWQELSRHPRRSDTFFRLLCSPYLPRCRQEVLFGPTGTAGQAFEPSKLN
jgi:hypothetical protein